MASCPATLTAVFRGAAQEQTGPASFKPPAPPTQPESLDAARCLIGRKVRKLFNTTWFDGRITKVAQAARKARKRKRDGGKPRFWYAVAYTDGDAEELDWEQLLPLLCDG